MTAPLLDLAARIILALMAISLAARAFYEWRSGRRTHAPSGKVNLASGLDQPRDARSSASKKGLPARLVSALRVFLLCVFGLLALLAAAALSGGGR